MSNVRPHILRQYLDVIYGGNAPTPKSVDGATVDEYIAMALMRNPNATPRYVLGYAPTAELRALADQFEPPPPVVALVRPRERTIERCAACDLLRSEIDPAVEELSLVSIKSISGWEALRSLRRLSHFQVTSCKSAEEVSLSHCLPVEHLSTYGCDKTCFETVIRSTSAETIYAHYTATPTLDLSIFRGHANLRNFHVSARLVRRIESLRGLPLESFSAKNIDPCADLRASLATLEPTLRRLSLLSTRPFGPALLPELPHLELLEVPGYPEFKEAWLDYAVAHPQMGFDFTLVGFGIPISDHAIEEIYRGIDISRIVKKKTAVFEIAGDVAGEIMDAVPAWEGDNYTLEEAIRAMAKKAQKKGISWSSESGTLVVRARDVETCRWIIDRVFEMAGR